MSNNSGYLIGRAWQWREQQFGMPSPLDRCTERFSRTFTLAKREAIRRRHESVDTEHVLLALMQVGDGIGARVLQNLGVELALVQARVDQLALPEPNSFQPQMSLASSSKRVIELAVDEARISGDIHIGTEHLLAGLVREDSGAASRMLAEMGVSLDTLRREIQRLPKEIALPSSFSLGQIPRTISPIFGLIVLVTVAAGYATYQQLVPPELGIFVFVTGGWLLSLCLHEFAHALVAYWGGDSSVVDEGYLTLNPLKYTHGVLSIALPMIYLAMGGIGLPGGAVYINRNAIRSRGLSALTSAAGPIATALCAIALLVPFLVTDPANQINHQDYWAGLALLAWLQVSALVFNLLPIPGLDGFGVIASFLPDDLSKSARGLGRYTLVFIFVLFYNPTFQRGFFGALSFLTALFQLDGYWVAEGLHLYKFWVRWL